MTIDAGKLAAARGGRYFSLTRKGVQRDACRLKKETSFVARGSAAPGFSTAGQDSAGNFRRGKAGKCRTLTVAEYEAARRKEGTL